MSQLALFAEQVTAVRTSGRPPGVERRWNLAFSEPAKLELLAVAAARPAEWLGWSAFDAVRERHQIGFCMGHVLGALVREGRLDERKVYCGKGIGAERPGSASYQGYYNEWRAIAPTNNNDKEPQHAA